MNHKDAGDIFVNTTGNFNADLAASLGQISSESTGARELEGHDEGYGLAKELVLKAGEFIKDRVQSSDYKSDTQWKADNTPVTPIDIEVNKIVIEAIKRAFPDDKIYGEEESTEGNSEYGYTWILDPVDGTQALGKLDTFTICLARLDKDGQPIFSFVYNPSRDELFVARKGEQSTVNGRPLKVSSRDTVKSSYIHFGSGLRFEDLATNGVAYDRLEGQGAKILNTRSLAFGCVEVAQGEFDGAFVGVKTPFEAASVKLLVEGAGGKVSDLYGDDPGRLDGEIRGLIVSNGLIHEALVASLQKAGS